MNTTIKARNRILSLALALCLVLGMTLYLPGPVTVSAAPSGSAGDANDGVDFDDLMFYFGTYKHADSWSIAWWEGAASYESNTTPILWRVVGEENGNMVALSEYVLDSHQFHSSQNAYAGSDIQKWLNTTFAVTGNFPDGEQNFPLQTTVFSRLYVRSTGDPVPNVTWGGDTYDSAGIAGTPVTQQFYLPWGTHGFQQTWVDNNHNKVGWDSGADKTSANVLDNNETTLKGGGSAIYYLLRSPSYDHENYSLFVYPYISAQIGGVQSGGVSSSLGVRPAFQFNPESVIFTSEIVDGAIEANGETEANGTDYSDANGVGANFKLTILNTNVKLDSLSDTDRSLDGDGSETLTIAAGGTLDLTGTISGGADNMVYKIVDRGTSEIVGYGAGNNTTDLTVRGVANVTDGNDLSTTGQYTLYVWAQDNNDDHSHEGSQPMWFPLKVKPDTTKPKVAGVFPSGSSVSLGTSSLSVTFDEDMDTAMPTDGIVNIDMGAALLNEAWQDNRTITYELDELQYSTTYTVNISGFKDLAGNVMDAHTYTFTTSDAPSSGQHMVTVRPDPEGAGSPSASHATAAENDIVTLTAKPNEGWEFTRWSSDSPGVVFDDDEKETTTFDMPDEDVMITAHYTEIDDGNGDNGNGDNNGNGSNNGGNSSSGSRSRSSSGGSSTPDRQVAKTQLPASAFSWDSNRTLTIDHERITPLGLLSVQWDGAALTRGTQYSVHEGSVIVRFDADFMEAQPMGEHTIHVEFMNCYGETTITVGGTDLAGLDDNDTHNPNTGGYPDGSYPGATDNPNTGDNHNAWVLLMAGSLGAVALVWLWTKAKRRELSLPKTD